MSDVAAGLREVADRVAAAAGRGGRQASDVRIVGAVKGLEVPAIEAGVAAGLRDLGENRAQDLAAKAEAVGGDVCWHYWGAIQTNKVRLLESAAFIHGLYREREVKALQARAERSDRVFDVLVQVNVAREASKQGVDPEGVERLMDVVEAHPRVRARGFMFVAPHVENPEDVRWVFTEGRRLRERFEGRGLTELSMGMTNDYEVAVEEGATIVRIGRAIFGSRTP